MVLFLHTLSLASIVTLIDILAALIIGLLLSRTNLRFKRLWMGLLTVPILLPPYVWAIGWMNIVPGLSGFSACAFILSLSFFPLALWLILLALTKINPSSEESGLLLGGWPKTLAKVTLPNVLPSLFLGGFLVFILSVSESGVPSLFHYNTLSLEIFTQYSAFSNLPDALKLCLPLVPLALFAFWLEFKLLKGKAFSFPRMSRPPLILPLASWTWPLTVLVGLVAFVLVTSPAFAILKAPVSWKDWVGVFSAAVNSLFYSVLYSFIAATLMAALGFCIAVGLERKNSPWARLADRTCLLLFAVPSAMLGVLQIFIWKRFGILYGSTLPLILAYIFQYIALPVRIQIAFLKQVPQSWEEAAYISGLSSWRYFSKIGWPLYRSGIFLAWSVSWIFCFKDLALTLLLYPPGNQTLAVRLFNLMPNNPPYVPSVLSLLLAIVTFLPILAILTSRPTKWTRTPECH